MGHEKCALIMAARIITPKPTSLAAKMHCGAVTMIDRAVSLVHPRAPPLGAYWGRGVGATTKCMDELRQEEMAEGAEGTEFEQTRRDLRCSGARHGVAARPCGKGSGAGTYGA